VFNGTLVKLIKFPAEHLTIFHGTLVFRGTPVENHWFSDCQSLPVYGDQGCGSGYFVNRFRFHTYRFRFHQQKNEKTTVDLSRLGLL